MMQELVTISIIQRQQDNMYAVTRDYIELNARLLQELNRAVYDLDIWPLTVSINEQIVCGK